MRKLEKGETPWFQFVANLFGTDHKEVKIGFDPMLFSAGSS